MALFQCKIFSQALYRSVNVNVILPLPDSNNDFFGADIRYPKPGEKYPVLYLLHGFSADESDWQRFSRIESYAQAKNLAVIMPDGYNSFYENSPFGAGYADYVAKELPAAMEAVFPISGKRENRFIAGLSMGGGGTYKLALRFPERYAAAASLSGGLNPKLSNSPGGVSSRSNAWRAFAFGKEFEYFVPEMSDLKTLLKKRVDEGVSLPRLYQCCGTEDFTYADNVEFKDFAKSLGVDLTWEEGPGMHNFDFWDPYIHRILDWLPINGGLVD
ncbi:MAG: esterase family protein [Lachnospiraceae bacterium]|nr:esterase family protein [Lachnospiraceae bacterium]